MKEFSSIIAALVSFAVTAFSGLYLIPFLKKLKFGQTILEDGPSWHEKKQGTPTMGGIMIIAGAFLSIVVALLMFAFGDSNTAAEIKNPVRLTTFLSGAIMALGMGLVGFLDDYIKVVKKRNLGLTAKQKTFFQLLVSAGYLLSLYLGGMKTTWVPFFGNVQIEKGAGLLFWPIALVFIYFFVNAVNLTDGIDGLCSSVTLVVGCAFMLASGFAGYALNGVLSAALAGGCVGFLVWNAHPAKVFMGDTGSLFLGGMVIAVAFGIGRPILLVLAGIIYLIEALSVVLQVAWFKKTGKRIFKMSPIHHHFEMCKWSEEKIVLVFSAITLVGCAVSLMPMIIFS